MEIHTPRIRRLSILDDSFEDVIRTQCEKKNLKQKELAKLCEVSPEYISQIFQGKKVPRTTICESLAKALDIDTHDLLLLSYWSKIPEYIKNHLRPYPGVFAPMPEPEREEDWEELKELYSTIISKLPEQKRKKILTIIRIVSDEERKEITRTSM